MTRPAATHVDQVLELLRRRGGRITTTRRAIVQAVLDADDHHVTAQELTERVRAAHPDIAPSTVYRTLDALVHIGVLQHTHLGHGPAVFHLAADVHPHIVCHVCGAVAEVGAELFDGLRRALAADLGFTLMPTHVALAGRCARC
jgi:Fe2+ or Zn2+ uptake regulation protein